MEQRSAITFRPTREILKAVEDIRGKEFCSIGRATIMLLEKALGVEGDPQSPMASLKQTEQELKIKAMQREDARKGRELLRVEEAVQVIEQIFAVIRQEGITFVADLAREHNLNARELEEKFLKRMAGNFDPNQIDYTELASHAADDFPESKS